MFEPVPFRSAIADGCTHLLVLCTRPRATRRSRVNSALADAMEAAIKKAVLSPDYMVPAWKVGRLAGRLCCGWWEASVLLRCAALWPWASSSLGISLHQVGGLSHQPQL